MYKDFEGKNEAEALQKAREELNLKNDDVYVDGHYQDIGITVFEDNILWDIKTGSISCFFMSDVDLIKEKIKNLLSVLPFKEEKPKEAEVKLVAYDEKGTELSDIEIIPEAVTATVTITSPSKVVPIQIVPIGDVAPGSAIESIESSVTQVTVYADETVLSSLNYIEVEIDVTGLNEDKTYQKVINKPNGARSISETSITINIKMEAETSKEFENIPIVFENLGSGLKVNAQREEDTKVTVSVGGVESLLDKLEASNIKAYVDLEGLGVGIHTVPVYVTGEDLKLTYTSKTQNIKIIIE